MNPHIPKDGDAVPRPKLIGVGERYLLADVRHAFEAWRRGCQASFSPNLFKTLNKLQQFIA